MTLSDIKEIAGMLNLGVTAVAVIIVVILCVVHVDKLLLLASAVQKVFSFFSQRARKGAISNSIRGRVMRSAKLFRSLGQDVMISDLKIEWVKEESAETFIENNQVIIRMAQNPNPHKNYVTAVATFVGQALLPKSRRYIDPAILNMSKLSVSRMLVLNGDADALEYFDSNFLSPILEKDEDAKEVFNQLRAIDKNGMFVNILLNEYAKATKKVFPDEPDPLLIAESKEMLTYLYRIAMGGTTDFDDFKFNREYFKIHIFLTANSRTYQRSGLRPYLKHIGESLSDGTETVYIFGLGRKVDIARKIVESLQETEFRVNIVKPHYYRHRSNLDGRTVQGVCYEVSVYEESEEKIVEL